MLSATFIRKTAALGLLAGYGTASLLTLADGSDGRLAIYLGALCGASLVLASLRRRSAGRTGAPDALRVDSPKRRWALLLIGVSSLVLAPLWTSLLVYGAHGYLSGKYSIRTGLKSDLRNLMEAHEESVEGHDGLPAAGLGDDAQATRDKRRAASSSASRIDSTNRQHESTARIDSTNRQHESTAAAFFAAHVLKRQTPLAAFATSGVSS